MKKIVVALSVFMIICFVTCGCGKKTYDSEPKPKNGINEEYSEATDATPLIAERKLIKTVSLSIETKTFNKYISDINSETSACGGYVENSERDGAEEYGMRNGSFTVRIPSDKLDGFVSKMTAEVSVLNYSENSEDITEDYIDAEARLRVFRAEEESLLEILKKAQSIDEIMSVRSRITEVREEIESLESRLKSYDNKVSYSIVCINVAEVEREVVAENVWEEIGNNLEDGMEYMGIFFREAFVLLVSALPFLIAIGVIVFVVVLFSVIIPKKRRKKDEQKQDK